MTDTPTPPEPDGDDYATTPTATRHDLRWPDVVIAVAAAVVAVAALLLTADHLADGEDPRPALTAEPEPTAPAAPAAEHLLNVLRADLEPCQIADLADLGDMSQRAAADAAAVFLMAHMEEITEPTMLALLGITRAAISEMILEEIDAARC